MVKVDLGPPETKIGEVSSMTFVNSFQEKIWSDKYQYKNETFEEYCNRIASNIFPKNKKLREELYLHLIDFKILFGGRTNSNIGIPEAGLTLFNCFIEAASKNPDSLEGIMDHVTKFAITLKTEGGVGFCADYLRPSNTLIRKIGVTTPGAIKFLEIYDKVSEVITSGNVDIDGSYQGQPTKKSIRKGATMVTMSINHPDIEDFITAKAVPNRLTKCNMSVLVSDKFMEAVNNDDYWELWFPSINYEKYDEEWNGDFARWEEKKLPKVVYKTVKARELWDLLLRNTYNRNEPGILFIDNIRRMDNISYIESCEISATNPCGEIPGSTGMVMVDNILYSVGDVCNLGSINTTKFYDVKRKKFDWDGFRKAAAILIRSLDEIIEISGYPLEEYENAGKLKRKVGAGVMGIGSLMMMMNYRYGGEACIEFLEKLLYEFMNECYVTSALLAKEKGPFPLYDKKLLENGYVKNSGILNEATIMSAEAWGLKNSAVAAIAPNGTLSIVAGNISGGLEPVFAIEFWRWNRVEGKKVDFEYPNVQRGEWFETKYFKEQNIADEIVLLSTDGKYRIDKNNGLCERVKIQDYGYKIAEENGFENTASATELSIEEHLNVLRVFAKYIDQSCSKTINLPNEITFDDFKSLYGNLYKYGIKGCTTYREGTSVGILETEKKKRSKSIKKQQKEFLEAFKEQETSDGVVVQNVKLPEQYPAYGYILKSEGKKWYVHVAFKDKACTRPFAIFVNTNAREDNVVSFNALEKLEDLANAQGLNNGLVEEVKRKYAYQKNPVKICRMLGFLLRHNVRIYKIVMALDEVEEAHPGTFVYRIKKFLAQFVRSVDEPSVCPNCNEKSLMFTEGCYLCTNCGHTRC